MTDYQAVPCPQCKGEMGIDIDRGIDWDRVKWYDKVFSLTVPYPHKIEHVKCGYCEGWGFIAVDVDKLVKKH